MGAFDDLIPVQEAPRGAFDDLIPERTELGPAWPAQEGEEAPQTVPEEVSRFFRPTAPSNKLQIAPLADVNAPMPEPKSFMQEVSEPLVSYQLEHPTKEGVLEAVGREAANLALGVAEFPTSELGVAAGVAGSLAPTATAGAFTLQMMKDLGNQVLSTYQNWGSMTPAQKAIALTDIAGTGVLGFLTGRATAKGLHRLAKTQEAITKAEPILPQAAQAAKETKGAEYAIEERNVPQGIPTERAGDDALRAPPSPGVSGSLQPATPSTAAQPPRPTPESRGVLLIPEEELTYIFPVEKGTTLTESKIGLADLAIPVNLAKEGDKIFVQDGRHRIERAKREGLTKLAAILEDEQGNKIQTQIVLKPAPQLAELTPAERLAEQRALDEALGQETEAQLPVDTASESAKISSVSEAKSLLESLAEKHVRNILTGKELVEVSGKVPYIVKNSEFIAELKKAGIQYPKHPNGDVDFIAFQKWAKPIADDVLPKWRRAVKTRKLPESAPPPKGTPTMPSAAEPSIPTPELPAAPGAKPVPISEATTALQEKQIIDLYGTRTDVIKEIQRNINEGFSFVERMTPSQALSEIGKSKAIWQPEIERLKRVGQEKEAPNQKDVDALRYWEGRSGKVIPIWDWVEKYGLPAAQQSLKNAEMAEKAINRLVSINKRRTKPIAEEEALPISVSTEPFLGKTKAEWTPEYYASLTPGNRRAARAQVISALKSEGGITRVTQESKPPIVLKGIHELLDLREKKKTVMPVTPKAEAAPEFEKRMTLEEEANDYIKGLLESKSPPKSADVAWQQFRRWSGNATRGTEIAGEDYFKSAWNAFTAGKVAPAPAKTAPPMPPGPGAASPAEFAQRQAGNRAEPPLPPPSNPPVALDAAELPTPDKIRQAKDYTPFNRANTSQWNFYFGHFGGAAKAAWERMNLGEFKMRESIARDVQDYVLRPLKALPRQLRKQGGKAFYEILDGKKMEDIRKEWEGKPEGEIVIAQAESIRTRLEEIRTTIRDLKRDSYSRALKGMDKDSLTELFKKNVSDKGDISGYTKEDLANGLVNEAYPDDWGIADGSYLPHLFFGHWKVSMFAPGMDKPQFVTRAQTAHEADVAVFKLVKQNPELKDAHFTIEEDTVVPADMIRLGDRKFWRMITEMKEQAQGAIDPKQAVQGIIGRKATKQKWFGSLQHRIGLEGYSKDYRRVMSAYLSGFHRWKELTAINREVQPLIEQTARNGRQQAALRLTDIFDNLWGKPTRLTVQFDNLIRRIPGVRDYIKPLALDRWARNTASLTTNLMLRTVRFGVINRLQPLQGLYPMVGERIMVQAKLRQHTKEGRALLDEAGVTFDPGQYSAEGLGGKFTRFMERLSGEQSNQELAFLAMYQHGIERGLAKPEAIKYAKLRGQLLTQFTPMVTDMPELFEGPVGRVLFQFKRFPVKQIELIAHMAGQRQFSGLTRMLLMFGAIGGASFFMRQFLVDPEKRLRFKRAMDEQFGQKGGDAIMYGLPGLLGADISGSIVLGEEPWGANIYEKAGRQLAGPTLSMGIEAMRGIRKEAREPISEWDRALAVMRRIPSLRQLAEVEALVSGDVDVMTPEGERKFRRTVTDALMGLGAFKSANEANLQLAVNGALEVEKERQQIMNRYFVASLQGSDAVANAVKEVMGFNERWPEYAITSENMSRYRDYRQRNIGKTDVERAVPKQLIPLLPASQR